MRIHCDAIAVKMVHATPLHLIRDAWRFSRPADNKSTLLDIAKIDLPVLEFAQFQVQFYVPILLREYICTARNHVVWARTSRVDDITQWPVFCIDAKVEQLFENCQADLQNMHQDQARMNLPLGYMTRFSASLNFRDYYNLIRLMIAEAERYEGQSVISRMFQNLAYAMDDELDFLVEKDVAAEMMKKKNKPIIGEAKWYERSQKADGNFVTISTDNLSVALRAQLVRHRPAMVSDDLRKLFRDDALSLPISTGMAGAYVFKKEDARQLVTTRNCWIAQEGLWSDFLDQIRTALGEADHPLPCDGGTCPYARDNQLRLEGKDPAPPCPKYALLYNEPLSYEHAKAAADYALTRKDTNFWLNILAEKAVTP